MVDNQSPHFWTGRVPPAMAAMLKGGQSGAPALHPGNSAGSRLVQMVSDQVEDLEMTPSAKRITYPALTKDEVQLLKTWIDEGLAWNMGTPVTERLTIATEFLKPAR